MQKLKEMGSLPILGTNLISYMFVGLSNADVILHASMRTTSVLDRTYRIKTLEIV